MRKVTIISSRILHTTCNSAREIELSMSVGLLIEVSMPKICPVRGKLAVAIRKINAQLGVAASFLPLADYQSVGCIPVGDHEAAAEAIATTREPKAIQVLGSL